MDEKESYCSKVEERLHDLVDQVDEMMWRTNHFARKARMRFNRSTEKFRENQKAVIEKMRANGFGRIVNVGSVNGQAGQYGQVNYAAAKSGIHGFTKALALEMAPYNINVNCVSPGPIDTPGFNKVFVGEARKHAPDIVPLGRVGLSEEVASAVVYLASDEAAFITGQTLAVDGGATMV